MENSNSIEKIIQSLKSLIESPNIDVAIPKELYEIEGFEQIYTALLDIRKAFFAIGKGDLNYPVKATGYFPGAIKSLQASLLHLTWQTKAISSGDFSQRVDFLGAFSESFNSMTSQLAATVKDLEIKEKESRESKEHFELIFNTSPDAIMITRLSDGCIVDVNEGFLAISGFSREEVVGKTSFEINMWLDPMQRKRAIDEVREKGFCGNFEFTFVRKDGGLLYGAISANKVTLQSVPHIVSVIHNITQRKEAEDALKISEEKYRFLTEFASDVIWVLNLTSGMFTYVSPAIYALSGFTVEEIMLKNLEGCLTPESFKYANAIISEKLKLFIENPNNDDYSITQLQQYCKNGEAIWIEVSSKFRCNINGEVEIVGVSRGIEERKKAEEQILYLSYNDQLTGLHNRRYYEEELKRLDDEGVMPLTLVMIDVNGLKLTNDAFGHKVGDLLLEKVAEVLQKECGDRAIIARIGGDEFVLLLPNIGALEAEAIINNINKATNKEKVSNIVMSLSIGYSVRQSKSDDIDEVFKRAEDEMYRHKLSESSSMRSKTIDLIMSTLFEKNNREMLHSDRVSSFCVSIAQKMNFDNWSINQIRIAGLMHDIGKIGVPERILNKTEKLTSDEWKELERHPEIGYRILSSVNEFSDIAQFILQHHEKWDGSGYPEAISGEQISLQSRIISVADAFDAMTSERTYRKKISHREAANELMNSSGTQFDPNIVDIFITKVLKIID